jgi:methyl-accepting chemotaxis protein
MLKYFARRLSNELKAKWAAIQASHAVIEFGMDGTILAANRHFLDVMGYGLGIPQSRGA